MRGSVAISQRQVPARQASQSFRELPGRSQRFGSAALGVLPDGFDEEDEEHEQYRRVEAADSGMGGISAAPLGSGPTKKGSFAKTPSQLAASQGWGSAAKRLLTLRPPDHFGEVSLVDKDHVHTVSATVRVKCCFLIHFMTQFSSNLMINILIYIYILHKYIRPPRRKRCFS